MIWSLMRKGKDEEGVSGCQWDLATEYSITLFDVQRQLYFFLGKTRVITHLASLVYPGYSH